MKRWIILIAVALVVAALALTTPTWLSPFLTFVGANANVIQGLQSLVQLVLWIVAGGLTLWGIVRRRTSQAPAAPTSTTRIETAGPGRLRLLSLVSGFKARADK